MRQALQGFVCIFPDENENGQYLRTAAGTIGRAGRNTAKLWLLNWATVGSTNSTSVTIHTNSMYVFQCHNRTQEIPWRYNRILMEIRCTHEAFKSVEVCFVYHECTSIADLLAKYGSGVLHLDDRSVSYSQLANSCSSALVVLDSCPPGLIVLLCHTCPMMHL